MKARTVLRQESFSLWVVNAWNDRYWDALEIEGFWGYWLAWTVGSLNGDGWWYWPTGFLHKCCLCIIMRISRSMPLHLLLLCPDIHTSSVSGREDIPSENSKWFAKDDVRVKHESIRTIAYGNQMPMNEASVEDEKYLKVKTRILFQFQQSPNTKIGLPSGYAKLYDLREWN